VRTTEARLRRTGAEGPAAWSEARSEQAEVVAVHTVRDLCDTTGAEVHIVHLSSAAALDVVQAAQNDGLPLTAETCPHFLEFTSQDFEEMGSILKTAPVVKGRSDRDRLWRGLADGEIAFVTTDHAAGVWPEEKTSDSIWTDYAGIPGVELLLPYLYSEGVCRGRITLERLTEVLASTPARFFGIHNRKGYLAPGYDADFVVLDEEETWTVEAEALHSKNPYTPLAGRELRGRIRAVYLRGHCVYQRHPDGSDLFTPPGPGQWIRRYREDDPRVLR
jgi:allantoinase